MSRASRLRLIGCAGAAGAVLLAWLSSPATMRLERTSGEPSQVERVERAAGDVATITIESRLFGLIEIGRERIDGVRSARMVDSRAPGADSRTPPHLVLETAGGDVNVGRPQQLFARDFDRIKGFLDSRAEQRVTLSSIGRSSELVRFVVAQMVVLLLGLGGLGLVWLGFRGR